MPEPFIDRRTALATAGLTAAGLVAAPYVRGGAGRAVAGVVAKGQRYDGNWCKRLATGSRRPVSLASHSAASGVLLKPNLVEPCRERPHMTTHPAMVVAAAEVFRGWGASVTVGEAPGHVRDTEQALMDSGVGEALADAGLPFARPQLRGGRLAAEPWPGEPATGYLLPAQFLRPISWSACPR